MPQRHTVRRSFALVAAAGTVALGLTACGGSSDSGGDAAGASADATLPSVSADESLAAQVPEAIAADGTITIGTDSTYAPSEFLAADGTTIQGFDVDLFTLVAAKLGLEVDFQTASFDSIIAGVDSGKYEVGVSSFTINPDRLAQVNMVSYFSAGTQWAVKAGNPEGVDPDDACGTSVAVQTGTVQVDDVTARSEKCTADGKPEITIDQYESQADATAAVVSGKDDAGLADSPVIAYAVSQTNGQLELAGDIYDSAPYGYVVPKAETEFAQAITSAVQSLIDDGSYADVLEKWGVEAGAITDPTLNPSVS